MYGGSIKSGELRCLSMPAATNQAYFDCGMKISNEPHCPFTVLTWLNAKVEDWKRIASSSRKDPYQASNVVDFPISSPEIPNNRRSPPACPPSTI